MVYKTEPQLPYFCEHCACAFVSKYNLTRHLKNIHQYSVGSNTEILSHPIPKKSHPNPKNSHLNPKISHPDPKNSHPILEDGINPLKCSKCERVFSSKWYLNRHQHQCGGKTNPYECQYCQRTFQHPRSRYKHYKTCTNPHSFEEKTSVPALETIVEYNMDAQTIAFKRDHLNIEELIKKLVGTIQTDVNRTIVLVYIRELYLNPVNRCIKKHNLEVGYSEVHLGNQQWEVKLDKVLYPKFVADLSNHLSELIYINRSFIPNFWFSKIIGFLDYMAIDGYINTDDKEKQRYIKNEYLLLVKELKLTMYNLTKNLVK